MPRNRSCFSLQPPTPRSWPPPGPRNGCPKVSRSSCAPTLLRWMTLRRSSRESCPGPGPCWCGCSGDGGHGQRGSRSCSGVARGCGFRCSPSAGRPGPTLNWRRCRPCRRGPFWRLSSICVMAASTTRRTCSASWPTRFSWRATASSLPRRYPRSASTIRDCTRALRSKNCLRSTTRCGRR